MLNGHTIDCQLLACPSAPDYRKCSISDCAKMPPQFLPRLRHPQDLLVHPLGRGCGGSSTGRRHWRQLHCAHLLCQSCSKLEAFAGSAVDGMLRYPEPREDLGATACSSPFVVLPPLLVRPPPGHPLGPPLLPRAALLRPPRQLPHRALLLPPAGGHPRPHTTHRIPPAPLELVAVEDDVFWLGPKRRFLPPPR